MKNTLSCAVAALTAMTLLATGCGGNDTIPKVQIGFKESGGVEKNGVLNICNGDTLSIDEVYVVTENSTPSTTIFRTDYYWDNVWIGQRLAPPFGYRFLIDVNRLGPHTLTIFNVVGANDYSLTNAVTSIPVFVLPSGTPLDSIK